MSGFVLPDFIRCPHCAASLEHDGGSLFCTGERRHTYDIAKEGYVNLLPPGRAKNSHTGDGADMIKAREEFLDLGGYDRYSKEAAELAAEVLLEPESQDHIRNPYGETEAVPISARPGIRTGINGRTQFAPTGNPTDASAESEASSPSCDAHHYSAEAVPIFARPGVRTAVLVDAGCGEGRHTVNMANTLSRVLGVPVIAAGFDASKFGVRAAAKRYVKNGGTPDGVTSAFAAANIFSLPVTDGCADVFTSLFAPLPEDEARRTLRRGGVLVICAAGADHLGEMRRVLYENPIPSGGGAAVPAGFTTMRETFIEYPLELSTPKEIMSLFTMTPFYHNAPPEGRAKLEALSSLTVTVQVKCTVAVKE